MSWLAGCDPGSSPRKPHFSPAKMVDVPWQIQVVEEAAAAPGGRVVPQVMQLCAVPPPFTSFTSSSSISSSSSAPLNSGCWRGRGALVSAFGFLFLISFCCPSAPPIPISIARFPGAATPGSPV